MAQILNEKSVDLVGTAFRDPQIINGGIRAAEEITTLEDRSRQDGTTRGNRTDTDLNPPDPDGAYRLGRGGTDPIDNGGEIPDTIVPHPDENLSPEDNLTDLYNQLIRLLTGQFGFNFSALNGQNYLDIVRNVLGSVNQIFDDLDLDDDYASAQLSFLEKVANVAQSYIDHIFTNILSYQSWYLQQEYNSPLNQLKRLEQAGLNSAFIFSSYGNTAQSSALSGGSGGSGFAATSQMSGAGLVAQDEKSSKRSAWAQMFGAGLNATTQLIQSGIESTKVLAEAENIKLMTPLQVQESVRNIQNLGLTGEYLKDQAMQIESTVFKDWFEEDKNLYQLQLQNSASEREAAQQALNAAMTDDFAASMGSIWLEEQVYTCNVIDKEGHRSRRDLTFDEVQAASKNGNVLTDGSTILSDEERSMGAMPMSVGVNRKTTSSKSSSSTEQDFSETSSLVRKGSQGYDDSGNSVRIGNTTYTLNTRRSRVDTQAYKDYMTSLKNRLLFATDRFNELSRGEVAHVFSSLDNYIRNYSKGLSLMYQRGIRQQLRSMMLPNSSIGD